MAEENELWLRVAALRGIQVPKRGRRADVSGDRFQVQVARPAAGPTGDLPRASRVLCDPSCRGVIGEFVVRRNGSPKRTRIATRPGLAPPPGDWRRALVEREAERLAREQPERRST